MDDRKTNVETDTASSCDTSPNLNANLSAEQLTQRFILQGQSLGNEDRRGCLEKIIYRCDPGNKPAEMAVKVVSATLVWGAAALIATLALIVMVVSGGLATLELALWMLSF